MKNKITEIKVLKSISNKFAARISDKIGIVKKDTSMFPYSATEFQIKRQVYGVEYNNLLFKTAKFLIEDADYLKLAIEMGCKFTTTFKVEKPKGTAYSDYKIQDGECFAIFEKNDNRVETIKVCETKKDNSDFKEFEVKETKNFYFINLGE